MMVGMELLHLIGNSIFLVTIGSIYCFFPTRLVRAAFMIEGFHLCEHLILTSSLIFIGKPIGFSTLFGYSGMVWAREYVVGYRVFWHFAMNLIPPVLIMKALIQWRHLRLHTST